MKFEIIINVKQIAITLIITIIFVILFEFSLKAISIIMNKLKTYIKRGR